MRELKSAQALEDQSEGTIIVSNSVIPGPRKTLVMSAAGYWMDTSDNLLYSAHEVMQIYPSMFVIWPIETTPLEDRIEALERELVEQKALNQKYDRLSNDHIRQLSKLNSASTDANASIHRLIAETHGQSTKVNDLQDRLRKITASQAARIDTVRGTLHRIEGQLDQVEERLNQPQVKEASDAPTTEDG